MSLCYWPEMDCDCDLCAGREDNYEDTYDGDGFHNTDEEDDVDDASDEEE
jgi:hypothetical protein